MMLPKYSEASRTSLFVIALSVVIVLIAVTGDKGLNALGLFAVAVDKGEIWRVLTANLAHFGWTHCVMNLAALLLCNYVFFASHPLHRFLTLLFISCLSVGLGIYLFNPHYAPYAGLSGAIHGLIVAGILLVKEYPTWLRAGAGLLFLGKLLQENMPYFESTDFQYIIGAQVAVEAHMYGAVGGLLYVLLSKIAFRTKENV